MFALNILYYNYVYCVFIMSPDHAFIRISLQNRNCRFNNTFKEVLIRKHNKHKCNIKYLEQTFQQLKPQHSDVVKRGTLGQISSLVTLIMLLEKS